MVLMEQRAKTMQCWAEPFVSLRLPKMFNLRRDPFERADENLVLEDLRRATKVIARSLADLLA